MKDPDNWIERYFENSLSAAELEQFHRRLEKDPEFARAFQLEKDLIEGIETLGNQRLKSELKNIYKEEIVQKEKPVTKRITRRSLMIAVAAVIAAFLVSWWVLQFVMVQSPEKLYAQYFQPEFDLTEKGRNQRLIAQVESTLKGGYYSAALHMLDVLLDEYPEEAAFHLAKGIALVETGNNGDGFEQMQKARVFSESYKNEVLWYQALTKLKQSELEESMELLRQIDDNSARRSEADELAEKIHLIRKE